MIDPLRPSEYTALLIQALRLDTSHVAGARVLEIGSGSGVVLAALGALGAGSLCGVDVEPEAILSGTDLLQSLGYAETAELHHGDMLQPVAGRRFDLIVANLPHFPTLASGFTGRLPSWSNGGPDGRAQLDRFINGLPEHLSPGGRALITHNAFVGLERSREVAADKGLSLRVVTTTMLHLPDEKARRMTESVLRAEDARSIHRYGRHIFAEMHIVEFAAAGGACA